MHTDIITAFLESAKKACIEVKALLDAPKTPQDFAYGAIGAGGDESLGLDLKAEAIFVYHFSPFASIDSEESGLIPHAQSSYTIILDPLDGSDNIRSLFPYYGTCMALTYKNTTIAAVVCNLVDQSYYYRKIGDVAMKGHLQNSHEIPMTCHSLTKIGIFEKAPLHTHVVEKLMKKKLKFRSPGALALSIVYGFHVNYVLFIGEKRAYDVAASLFIAESLPRYEDDNTIIIAQNDAMLHTIKAQVLEEKI